MSAARNAFGRTHRLLTPADFRQVFSNGRKQYARDLAVYVRSNSLGYPRLGIAVSRKCARSAVVRNRIKRAIRETFRTRKQGLGANDIVFLAQPGLARHDRKVLRSIVEAHLAEIEKCERS